jgi:hypothetical protein
MALALGARCGVFNGLMPESLTKLLNLLPNWSVRASYSIRAFVKAILL